MSRSWIALGGSAAVAVAVVVVVLVFGIIPLPDYPSLRTSPDPEIPGAVAFFRPERTDSRCLWTVPASGGEPRRVTCRIDDRPLQWGAVAWTTAGQLAVVHYDEAGEWLVVLDAETGQITERIGPPPTTAERPVPRPPGQGLARIDRTRRGDGAVLITSSPEQRVATVAVRTSQGATPVLRAEGPRDYAFPIATWSPDGRYILVQDSSERLLVMGEDGSNPRLLVTDATEPVWFIPGQPAYTIDVEAARAAAGG